MPRTTYEFSQAFLLTPLKPGARYSGGDRFELYVTPEEANQVLTYGVRGFRGEVLDQRTDQHYRVYGAYCGVAGCFCDTRARPVDRDPWE